MRGEEWQQTSAFEHFEKIKSRAGDDLRQQAALERQEIRKQMTQHITESSERISEMKNECFEFFTNGYYYPYYLVKSAAETERMIAAMRGYLSTNGYILSEENVNIGRIKAAELRFEDKTYTQRSGGRVDVDLDYEQESGEFISRLSAVGPGKSALKGRSGTERGTYHVSWKRARPGSVKHAAQQIETQERGSEADEAHRLEAEEGAHRLQVEEAHRLEAEEAHRLQAEESTERSESAEQKERKRLFQKEKQRLEDVKTAKLATEALLEEDQKMQQRELDWAHVSVA